MVLCMRAERMICGNWHPSVFERERVKVRACLRYTLCIIKDINVIHWNEIRRQGNLVDLANSVIGEVDGDDKRARIEYSEREWCSVRIFSNSFHCRIFRIWLHHTFDRVDKKVLCAHTLGIARARAHISTELNIWKTFLMSYVYLHIIYGLQYLKRLLFAMLCCRWLCFFSHFQCVRVCAFFLYISYLFPFVRGLHSFWLANIRKLYSSLFFSVLPHSFNVYLLLTFEYLCDLLRKNLILSNRQILEPHS